MANGKSSQKSGKGKSMKGAEIVMEEKTKEIKKEEKMAEEKQNKENLKEEVVADLTEIQKVVKDAIDKGAANVEQVHLSIAKMPLKYLEKIERIESAAKKAGDIQEKTIGYVYDLIRRVNGKVDGIAKDMLQKAAGR